MIGDTTDNTLFSGKNKVAGKVTINKLEQQNSKGGQVSESQIRVANELGGMLAEKSGGGNIINLQDFLKLLSSFNKGNVEVKVGNNTTNSLAQGENDFQQEIIVTEYRVNNNSKAERVNQVSFNDQVEQSGRAAALAQPEVPALEDDIDMK